MTGRIPPILPGVAVCLAGAVLSWLLSRLLPGASPLLIAILLGAVWGNLLPVPALLHKGVGVSAKNLLRAGIVLLGLQLSLSAVLELGPGALLIVLLSVGVTFAATLWFGKLLGISFAQRLLIASGFSICGAAAVAATETAAGAKKTEVATAIGLVVLFGTLMIPAVPFLGDLLGLSDTTLGIWIGASTHEVAQVVAAGDAVGSSALAVAVTVKLARVLTLAPITAGIALHVRRKGLGTGGTFPPIVPLFIVGFVAAMLLRTAEVLPPSVLEIAQILQTLLLSAAMFALGLGVELRSLLRVGRRPVLLGLLATLVILVVSLIGTVVLPLA
ncbi:YeiH family protein [uncultured Arthrobacter sp.]|uniref:YeiH family protein n=1 Tax=uncultured Arthrobacter sp. TaxID=114050 RepID=UPI0026080217|nr:putative sulfate exporter family transporter [uncultured Arthrobacter sp.]